MLLTDEVLSDALSLELSDPLSSVSFPPVSCAYWLFLYSLVLLSRESLSPSYCHDEVHYAVADSVVDVVLVGVPSALPLPLPLFRRGCS